MNVLLRDLPSRPHEYTPKDERNCAHLWMTVVFLEKFVTLVSAAFLSAAFRSRYFSTVRSGP